MFAQVNREDLAYWQKILGPAAVVTAEAELAVLGKDWTQGYTAAPAVALLPRTVEEVSQILRYCHERYLPVVPSGGRTGLAAGAVAARQEVVLSLSRMNRILAVNTVDLSIETEAGVTTQALQMAAEEQQLFFPLDLAAKGSCQIGGNIATNAGGLKLIRFGGTREQVLGLEVVLADGKILDLNTKLRKNNSGYDLKQLFIGSEGTLGVVTKATLRLVAQPAQLLISCVALSSPEAILALFQLCHRERVTISAFEFFSRLAHEKVLRNFPQIVSPFPEKHPYYVLLELEGEERQVEEQMERLLSKALEEGMIQDAVISQSSAQFREIWALRENITESLAASGRVRKNDISLPIPALSPFIAALKPLIADLAGVIELVLFGHIGDGNLHINYTAPRSLAQEEFTALAERTEKKIFSLVQSFRGSISAEHGIGLLKAHDLHYTRSVEEIAWMKQIKQLFDPRGILNPGKIFADLPQGEWR